MKIFRKFAGCYSAALFGLMVTATMGCTNRESPYPVPQVTSPLNRAGTCEACGRRIENVNENQLITHHGNGFIVCDEKCAEKVKKLADRR